MIVKLFLPDDWSEEINKAWLYWLDDRINDPDVLGINNPDYLLNKVIKVEREKGGSS